MYAGKHDIRRICGRALEEIPSDAVGHQSAIVLTCTKWRKLYFLRPRESWNVEDYFEFAEKKMEEIGITEP
jgi:hypothetical protein